MLSAKIPTPRLFSSDPPCSKTKFKLSMLMLEKPTPRKMKRKRKRNPCLLRKRRLLPMLKPELTRLPRSKRRQRVSPPRRMMRKPTRLKVKLLPSLLRNKLLRMPRKPRLLPRKRRAKS